MSVARWIKQARAGALGLLFPMRCLACEHDLPSERLLSLCEACRGKIVLLDGPRCGRCASPVPTTQDQLQDCARCLQHKPRFDRVVALGEYQGLLRDLVLRMKTDSKELLARTLVDLTVEEHQSELKALEVDVVVPVPTHPWRARKRGTKAPEALASRLSVALAIPLATRALRRRVNTPQQAGLSRAGRLRNLRGAFNAREDRLPPKAHVLLVDDVLTTGATCEESARVLRRAGAGRVSVFVIARTAHAE